MERTEIIDMMAHLKLYGMRMVFDEVISNAVKRQHAPRLISHRKRPRNALRYAHGSAHRLRARRGSIGWG
jgi:hypothetical protein